MEMEEAQQNPAPPPPESADIIEEPPIKKPKMSSTSEEESGSKPRRYKRRKVAIFMAYCGVGYQGMQKNPGAKTIEGDLEDALFLSGAVPDDERGQHKRYDWARSARTDKGVSAVGQVVSGRFFVDPPGFVHRLNSILSPQIRVFGFKRATPSFSAKKFCDRRRYVYLLPVFALDPCCHRDRESVMASLGSGQELVRCFECSERGRKVLGVMGNSKSLNNTENDDDDDGVQQVSVISSDSCNASVVQEKHDEAVGEKLKTEAEASGGAEEKEDGVQHVSSDSCNASVVQEKHDDAVGEELKTEALGEAALVASAEEEKDGEKKGGEDEDGGLENGMSKRREEFKYGEEVKERLNRILEYYKGTHNFHNFTTRTKAEDPSAKRYIVSFEANTTLSIQGIEFVKCEVVGQSFMLHQIRKMIGMAVAVMRNFAPESIYHTAFDQVVRINVPTAPEVGLYLDECFFTSYNNKWEGTHEELSMKSYAEEAEAFKLKYIYTHIANTEHKEGSVALWLHSLNKRNYPDLCPSHDSPQHEGAPDAPTDVQPPLTC